MLRRHPTTFGLLAMLLAAVLGLAFLSRSSNDAWIETVDSTTTTAPPPVTTEPPAPTTTEATTTIAPPLPVTRRTITEPAPAPAQATTAPAAPSTYDCPPDPELPGVEYRCYPGAARLSDGLHRGFWCDHHPECPGKEVIAVDPVRGDPYCALKNELYNREHRGEFDPYGSCPP